VLPLARFTQPQPPRAWVCYGKLTGAFEGVELGDGSVLKTGEEGGAFRRLRIPPPPFSEPAGLYGRQVLAWGRAPTAASVQPAFLIQTRIETNALAAAVLCSCRAGLWRWCRFLPAPTGRRGPAPRSGGLDDHQRHATMRDRTKVASGDGFS